MKPAAMIRPRVNEHGQVFVHVYPNEMYVFNLTPDVQPKVIPLPRRVEEATRTSIARDLLREMGWGIGVDGWRAPLSPASPIVATAHLYRLADEPWRVWSDGDAG
jgi:hypothetical protein